MIRQILFDFDGTIVQSLRLALLILNKMAEKYRYRTISMEEMQILKHLPLTERLKEIGFPIHQIPAMAAESAALYRRGIAELKPVPGVGKVLSALKEEGCGLSILSSNSVDNIEEFLHKNRLELFEHICSANNLFGKDKSLQKFIRKYGASKDGLLYVGDETRDIDACKKVGVRIAAAAWGYDPLPLLRSKQPDFIAEVPEDILRIAKML